MGGLSLTLSSLGCSIAEDQSSLSVASEDKDQRTKILSAVELEEFLSTQVVTTKGRSSIYVSLFSINLM